MEKIKMKDIAELAGVSPSTVANVIHGRTHKVSQDTLKRVQDIIERTGYIPCVVPKILSGKHSKVIGIVAKKGQERWIPLLEERIYRNGYYMVVHFSDDLDENVRFLVGWNTDAAIFVGFKEEIQKDMEERCCMPVIILEEQWEREEIIDKIIEWK